MLQAVTVAPHQIEIIGNTRSDPGTGMALVRVERVGVCGSDLHIFHGKHPRVRFPLIQGHEASGRIEELPADYHGPLTVGDRVAIDPLIPCGQCYACRLERTNCCPNLKVIGAQTDGFLREYALTPLFTLHRANSLDADTAALCEPVSVGLQAVHRGEVQTGEQVLIFGAGTIGATVTLAAIDRGASVMMVDTIQFRLDLMTRLGVERTHLAGSTSLIQDVRDWAGPDGPPVTIDAVGAPSVIRQCCQLVSPAGRVVIVGLSDQEVSLPIVDFTYKEMTILGSRASAGRFREAIQLAERCRAQLGELITHRFPLQDTESAIEHAASSSSSSQKVMIEVWDC